MAPVLVDLSGVGLDVVVRSYSAFLVVAALAALALGVRAVGRLGVGRLEAAAGFVVAVLAGLAGARLVSVLLDAPAFIGAPHAALELAPRHFALYGGIAGGAIAMALVARRWQLGFGVLADASIVPVAGGIALVRVGCFLNGCCAGIESDLPWAVTFPEGSTAWGTQVARGGLGALLGHADAVHPTQLYEAAAALACAGLALVLRKSGGPPAGRTGVAVMTPAGVAAGVPALAFAASFLAFRVVNQLLRPASPDSALPEPAIVALYALAAIIAVGWLAVRLRARGPAGAPDVAPSSGWAPGGA